MKDSFISFLSNSTVDDTANKITSELQKYDVIDYLTKISALYLFPHNQNKSLVFDTLIASILEKPKSYYSGIAKVSNNKFKNITDYSMNFPIAENIDPPEMPFVYRILFFGNYFIFSGIGKDIGYRLQAFLDILFKNKNRFNKDFVHISSLMVHFILTISTKICTDYSEMNVPEYYEQPNIYYPNTQNLQKLQQSLYVDIEFIKQFIVDDELESLMSVFGERQYSHIDKPENFRFYYKPFIKINETTFCVLNPTELGAFLINYILKKSYDFGEFDKLIKAYNDYMFRQCIGSFANLGHKKLSEESLDIKLLNTNSYKEILLNVANNGLLFIQFFCDSGEKYNFKNAHEQIEINNHTIGKRWEYISSKLKDYPQDRVYQVCIPASFSRIIHYKTKRDQSFRQLLVSPFDLYCIAINERSHRNFIPRYLDCKSNMFEPFTVYGDIYNISVYCQNYSFYLDDNFDYRKDLLYLGFDSALDYYNKALSDEDKFLADFPNSKYLLEMVQVDPFRKIYECYNKNTLYILNKFPNIEIWQIICTQSSIAEINLHHTITDMCSYWLAECKNIVLEKNFINTSIVIEHKLTGDLNKYISSESYSDSPLEDLLKIIIVDNKITLNWTPESFFKLTNVDNSQEKKIIALLLEALSCFSDVELSIQKLDKIFENPLKKKVFALNHQKYPYLKYIDLNFRVISVEYEQQLLDEIGYFLINEKGIPIGRIKAEDKYAICSSVVDYLYEKLKDIISSLQPQNLIEQIYLDLEKAMYSMMLMQKRHAANIACHPEKANELNLSYSQLNKSSVALKFFIEYVAAQPPKGNVILGELEYENILTICSAIVHWAQIGDLFKYNIIDSEMNILKSGRVGIENTQTHDLTESTYSAAIKRLMRHSNPHIEKYHFDNNNIDSKVLNEAFTAEFGYSYDDLSKIVFSLITVGNDLQGEIYKKNIIELCDTIIEKTGIEKIKLNKVIDDLSLKERSVYLPAPEGYNNTDVWPWRFNRRLSFTRRPLIIVGDKIVWGNRQLFHCLLFTYDLIKEGNLKADSKELKQLIGKIADNRGNQFNDAVIEKLRSIRGLIVDGKVQKINGRKIINENQNTLGDIDVLIINFGKKRIIVGEVKDFSFSKSPYEMQQQYLSVFCDNGKKLCYISKHKRRVDWVKNHLDDVIEHYRLPKGNWKVDDILILSEPIISNEYYHKKQKCILFSDISEKTIFRL